MISPQDNAYRQIAKQLRHVLLSNTHCEAGDAPASHRSEKAAKSGPDHPSKALTERRTDDSQLTRGAKRNVRNSDDRTARGTRHTVCLDLGDELHLLPMQPAQPIGTLSGSAEAVLRPFYGRNRGADGVTAEGKVTLNDLRALFPGL